MKKVYILFLLPCLLLACSLCSFAQRSASALPALIEMNAQLLSGNRVAVSWTVLQKVNTNVFEIEKSNDGLNWRSVAIVNANSEAAIPCSYSTIDLSPVKGSNFYRVLMRDINGNTSFTVIKNVRVNSLCKLNVYPNPASDHLSVLLGQVPVTDWQLSILSVQGQVMLQKKYSRSAMTASLPVKNFPAGNYMVEIMMDNVIQTNALIITH